MHGLNEANEILITREFAAPRALLFKLWTDPFHLAPWWPPYGFQAKVITFELRQGGTFHIELKSPDGKTFPAKAVFQKIIEPETIVLLGDAHAEDACGSGLPPNALISISLQEKSGITTMNLHTVFDASAAKRAAGEAGFYGGWESALNALDRYLNKVKIVNLKKD